MRSINEHIQLIESFMKAVGGSSREWIVGVAKDGKGRLTELNKDSPLAEVWELDDVKRSIAILAYFLQSGCALDRSETDGTQLYAFKGRVGAKTFKQFLEAKDSERGSKSIVELKAEWVSSLQKLMVQIKEWLRESDPENKILTVADEEHRRIEEGIGIYVAPGLMIGLGAEFVRVVPVARSVVGVIGQIDLGVRVEGRVDITNDVQKFALYRTLEGGESWLLHTEDDRFVVFSRSNLEMILQELLS
jgi:hypothetical protein